MRQHARPLLWDARHTRAWPVLTTCVIVIAALGLLLRKQSRPDGFDSVVDTATVASFSGHQRILPWLALPGSTIPLIAVSVVIAVGCLVAGRRNGVVLAVTAVPVTAFLDDRVLKHLIGRTHLGQLSFPSGHAASAMTLATVLGVLLHDPARRTADRAARTALVVAACAVTALVAVGVVGLRWHYFTDTVGGVALGAGTVLALAFVIDLAPGALRSGRLRRRRESAQCGHGAGLRRRADLGLDLVLEQDQMLLEDGVLKCHVVGHEHFEGQPPKDLESMIFKCLLTGSTSGVSVAAAAGRPVET